MKSPKPWRCPTSSPSSKAGHGAGRQRAGRIGTLIKSELALWTKVIKDAGIKPEWLARNRAAQGRASAASRAKEQSMSRGPWIDHFGDNFLWSNATLIIKGMAPYGVVALEEMDRACERLRPRWNEPTRQGLVRGMARAGR